MFVILFTNFVLFFAEFSYLNLETVSLSNKLFGSLFKKVKLYFFVFSGFLLCFAKLSATDSYQSFKCFEPSLQSPISPFDRSTLSTIGPVFNVQTWEMHSSLLKIFKLHFQAVLLVIFKQKIKSSRINHNLNLNLLSFSLFLLRLSFSFWPFSNKGPNTNIIKQLLNGFFSFFQCSLVKWSFTKWRFLLSLSCYKWAVSSVTYSSVVFSEA